MTNIETAVSGLNELKDSLPEIINPEYLDQVEPATAILEQAVELLNLQSDSHRLMVHNIGNVDCPEGVTLDQFNAVMGNVCAAIEHTEKGESWPYE